MEEERSRPYFLRWSMAIVYTCAILGITLASEKFSPWALLVKLLGGDNGGTERAGTVLNYGVPLLGLAALAAGLLTLRKKRFRSMLWLGAVAGGFLYLLAFHCVTPMEQVHLLMYGLLAWLFYRAFSLSWGESVSLLCAALVTCAVGAGDEWLQSTDLLPTRHGTWEDVFMNWEAGALGLLGLMACMDGGYWRWHKRRNLGLRFFLGYVLPTALIVVAAQQLYTRFLYPPINLLIITVDCARPTNMSAYDYPLLTTPNLDRIMPESARFDNAFSQACWTCPGVVSTLTGLYPPAHGVRRAGATLPEVVPTILDGFRQKGYRVPNLAYLTEDPTFHNLGSIEPMDPRIAKDGENSALRSWLGQNYQKPFAVWFHYRGIHLPYHPSEDHLLFPPALAGVEPPPRIANLLQKEEIIPRDFATFEEEDKAWIKSLYDAEMHEFDAWFEAWRYQLKLHHILDNTLIVITADHGEELLEHGDVGHGSTLIHSKHYDEQLHIPLIMHCPRLIPEGRQIKTLVQQVDILPTIYELMDWPVPPKVEGRSLVPALRGEEMVPVPVYAESIEGGYQSKEEMADMWVRSRRTTNYKFIEYTGKGEPEYELYNLSQDPEEHENLATNYPAIVAQQRLQLDTWLEETLAVGKEYKKQQAQLDEARAHAKDVDPALLIVPEVLTPKNGAELDYDSTDGTVLIEWTGPPEALYVRQISAGTGFHRIPVSEEEVAGTRLELGPFPKEFWGTLYKWNPFRFRVRPKGLPDGWSDWIEVNIAPLPAEEE